MAAAAAAVPVTPLRIRPAICQAPPHPAAAPKGRGHCHLSLRGGAAGPSRKSTALFTQFVLCGAWAIHSTEGLPKNIAQVWRRPLSTTTPNGARSGVRITHLPGFDLMPRTRNRPPGR
ncbi:hypothetical protein GCM10010346_58010 [Streptomyces chryseus]|uniref:Uncharacterized protein n=1 Tax=Streptomyces chryseus TaxID=68186 RepID=A0ABQ3E5L4_9ACTN|nr:hypothetical protein GCM10010346_58010 [Streptomyces chryseus]